MLIYLVLTQFKSFQEQPSTWIIPNTYGKKKIIARRKFKFVQLKIFIAFVSVLSSPFPGQIITNQRRRHLGKHQANFNQTLHKEFLCKGGPIFTNKRPLNLFSESTLQHNNSFAQMCLLTQTVSQVSDMAHRPLVRPIYCCAIFTLLIDH